MSGPVRDVDLADGADGNDGLLDHVEVREGRRADVGGLDVVRVLPTKGRRTVGAWCFVDLLGPVDMADPDPLEIGPHPHIGLSTVTWLLEGEALHTDSLGTEQVIRAGQLNLMTAGHGISHAELAAHPPFQGAQLWIAQPEATRHGAPAFEHHAELPRVEIVGSGGTAEATLLVGGIGDRRSDASAAIDATDARSVRSPARADTPLVGADVLLAPGATTVPLDPGFEHAVAPIDAPVLVGGHVVEPGSLALVPAGVDELVLTARDRGARILLLGGEPLESPVVMWWNFVARDRDEITDAWRSWNARDERFGTVASPLDRIEAPAPPWIRA
jgi:redox-sensitive bicupin YhaK (pirin superfamily)